MELILLLIIILLFFGYRRLPQLGRSVGRGVQEFRGELGSQEAPEKEHPEAVKVEEEGENKAKAEPDQEEGPRERS